VNLNEKRRRKETEKKRELTGREGELKIKAKKIANF